ncbi:hypothetical protein H4R33_005470, partial [Dimargaris cristalligena]
MPADSTRTPPNAWNSNVAIDVYPRPGSSAALLPPPNRPTSNWVDDEQQLQTTVLRQQDQQLDSVMGTVKNIRQMAHTMGSELEDHNVMLEEMDTQTDSTQNKLSRAMRGIDTIIRKNS